MSGAGPRTDMPGLARSTPVPKQRLVHKNAAACPPIAQSRKRQAVAAIWKLQGWGLRSVYGRCLGHHLGQRLA